MEVKHTDVFGKNKFAYFYITIKFVKCDVSEFEAMMAKSVVCTDAPSMDWVRIPAMIVWFR